MTMTTMTHPFETPQAQDRGQSWHASAHGHRYDQEGSFAGSAGHAGERLLGKRVLIVEDEALLALELQFAFEDEGAEVLGPAMSLNGAVALVTDSQDIDLAVLDVDIAGQDVYPVAAMLQQRGIPFVFHTAHGSRTELAAMFPSAVTCTKPTMPDTLVVQLLGLGRQGPTA